MADRQWRRNLTRTSRPPTPGEAPRLRAFDDDQRVSHIVEGSSASAAQTELALSFGTFGFALDGPGVPVARAMEMSLVATSWLSDDEPAGEWTLTLYKREAGGSMAAVATFSVNTTNP